jgi:hypothetical protein
MANKLGASCAEAAAGFLRVSAAFQEAAWATQLFDTIINFPAQEFSKLGEVCQATRN